MQGQEHGHMGWPVEKLLGRSHRVQEGKLAATNTNKGSHGGVPAVALLHLIFIRTHTMQELFSPHLAGEAAEKVE